MKIALICPSNITYMPYVSNYEVILKEKNVDYTIINWDRFNIENNSEFVYRDNKIGHRRNFYDYYKYYRFIRRILKNNHFDKIIVFGLQLIFFLKGYLIRNYKNKYIIDIRDYNKILKIFNPTKAIGNSAFTVISSAGYKQWLPKSNKYIINHNTKIDSLTKLQPLDIKFDKKQINISCIGAIRDYGVNIEFIDSLKNVKNINLFYHGEGLINEELKTYLKKNSINNVFVTGRYDKGNQEDILYRNADLVNLFISDTINSKTCLANRLYNGVLYGKPLLTLEDTYLAEIIKKYDLGLVLKSFKNIKEKIYNYLENFDTNKYNYRRKNFLREVIDENKIFIIKLSQFLLQYK